MAGHDSKVLWNDKITDTYGIYDFYKNFMTLYPQVDFAKKLIDECKSADIIHVHANIYALIKLRKILGQEKKIILHYHGTDIRGLRKWKIPFSNGSFSSRARISSKYIYRKILHRWIHSKAQKLANLVCISQIDLLSLVPNAVYIPIAVDTSHFNTIVEEISRFKTAVTIKTELTDMGLVLDYCKKNNIQMSIKVHDRTTNPIKYKDMPRFLRDYETYVDVRFVNGKILGDLSSTALQSLACGLKVLSYDLTYIKSLPKQHDGSVIASKVMSMYERLIKR